MTDRRAASINRSWKVGRIAGGIRRRVRDSIGVEISQAAGVASRRRAESDTGKVWKISDDDLAAARANEVFNENQQEAV